MSNAFFEVSKGISDEFIQSVAFFDDEASYSESTNDHHLNAQEVIQMFASQSKLCSVYKIGKKEDIDNVVSLSQKSDVTVLDWRINFPPVVEAGEDEESDDEQDIRGKFTTNVIQKLFEEKTNKIKLIIIYTGENEFDRIIEDIKKGLEEIKFETEQEGFNLTYKNYRISLFGKATLKGRRLRKEIEERLLEYGELPKIIVNEFTKISSGLLTNVALKALSVVRENTFALLSTFDKKLDPAFLAHKALLPAPNDASDHILEIIGSEIKSLLLSYNATEAVSNNSIKHFIENTISEKDFEFDLPDKERFSEIEIPKTLSRDMLIKFSQIGIENVLVSKDTPVAESKLFADVVHKILTKYYLYGEISEEESNRKLALLTLIKSIYTEKFEPTMTLGTIVTYKDEYWVCITPQCDCTRIKKNRNILFARLKTVEFTNSFDFILNRNGNYLHFKINDSIHQTRFFKLKGNGDGAIKSVIENEKHLYKGESILEHIGELKNDFAQSIANNFSAQLARVGMDHSEWLRRS